MPDVPPPLVVLHRDDELVAVAKPPGTPVIPDRRGATRDCLRHRLEQQIGRHLWVVHRIDRDASGVVVFALDAEAHRAASLAFEHREVGKAYAAFVAGGLEPWRGRIDVPLHAARRGKTRPARSDEPGALPATTEYTTRERWAAPAPVSLLDVHPVTGRHHQIRVHLRAAGAPILFDPLYGRGLMPPGLASAPCQRLALHARRIDVPAFRGGGRVVIEAPLPGDLVALAEWLGQAT